MEEPAAFPGNHEKENLKNDSDNAVNFTDEKNNIQLLSVDKITVEKIVKEERDREGHLRKFEKIKKSSELTTKKIVGKFGTKEISKLSTGRVHKAINTPNVNKIIPIKLSKSSSIGSLIVLENSKKNSDLLKICKNPPKVPPKPDKIKAKKQDNEKNNIKDQTNKLIASVEEIERLQKNLVKIDSSTAEAYKQKLPNLNQHILKFSPIVDLDINENLTDNLFDKDFLAIHGVADTSKIEDNISESENILSVKPRYSKAVSEVEKRWSGEYLDHVLDKNSSESSKSSYIEELGSISSHDSVLEDISVKSFKENSQLSFQKESHENTVSTVDTNSCFEERIIAIDEYFKDENGNESVSSTLNESSSTKTYQNSTELENNESLEINQETENYFDNNNNKKDGYANLIQEITMEAGSSRGNNKDEKKKKSGFRRLLPGIFSPKDPRKDYKKEHKERKKRDERHFSQHQQNGVYTRSPDTMNLNEDIKRNVNLDTSLNGSIIEERLNEIKQELFPEQGMTTSTPDHFLQVDHNVIHGRRTPRIYTTNSSLSSIAVEDKWIDQNIISGSPDMRQIKQNILIPANNNNNNNNNEGHHRTALERKHSFQDAQPRFFRNHGPSGRISAPPSERYLIRPRAVHPVDRPLPAIPQKIEFSNYENHERVQQQQQQQQQAAINHQETPYYCAKENYVYDAQLYENGRHIEKPDFNRNQSIDSGFNSTPVSGQAKINKQLIANQQINQKIPVNLARSPKYSPSSSQKSGDYADSSYTPNSSQKSEFSPGSSKSGEYYLNSPRNSCRTSPDSSFNDRRDGEPTSYQVPSNIRVHSQDEQLYDEAPRASPYEPEELSANPRHDTQNTNPEVPYVQKASPNIPLSSNLAKLRANMEHTRPESPRSPDNQHIHITSSSPSPRLNESIEKRSTIKSPISNSPRVTSPLTILPPPPPPAPASPCSNTTISSCEKNPSRSGTPKIHGPVSPNRLSIQTNQGSNQKPISSPTMWNTRSSGYGVMSTFQPRKSQPNDQILIASPKRELVYDTERLAESPGQMSSLQEGRHNIHTIDKKNNSNNSPTDIEICNQPPPQAFQDKPTSDLTQNEIQRPQPKYVQRQEAAQRTVSPVIVNTNVEKNIPQVYEDQKNMLLIKTCTEDDKKIKTNIRQEVKSPNHQQNTKTSPKNNTQIVASRLPIPEIRKEPSLSPERPDTLHLRRKDTSPSQERPQGIYGDQRMLPQNRSASNEQIYGIRPRQLQLPQQTPQRHEAQVHQQKKTPPLHQLSPQVACSPPKQAVVLNKSPEQIYGWQVVREPIYAQKNQKQDPIYSQNPNRQLSPSKKQTLQNLEAYYWQQKALETSRSSTNSPTTSNRSTETNTSGGGGPPEVREAIYWQQLKKLDEEQQRKIYERNQFEERNELLKKNIQSPSSINDSNNSEQIYWMNKMQPKPINMAAKPPIAGQKGQNQPVLVVRPQQAPVRDLNQNQINDQLITQNVSPNFIRGDERRSLQLPRRKVTMEHDDGGFNESKMGTMIQKKNIQITNYEDNDEKKNNPPPIFKRGSLISNSSNSVDYGTLGTKRVSFSNQAKSPEIGSGHWPTKHGMAPEPPTRKHREEDKTSDSINLSYASRVQEENQNNTNNIYGNTTYLNQQQHQQQQQQQVIYQQTEYDAKPLPPTPRGAWTMKRSNSMRDSRRNTDIIQQPISKSPPVNSQKRPGVCESESGSEAGEISRTSQHHSDEEWNPGGKGRQSNDTGGTGRVEGEGGSNDIPSGRRILGNISGGRSGGSGGGGGRSRDEPRRHTLSGDHAPSLHHQQFNAQQLHPLHPHHLPPPHGQYGTLPNRHTTMDLEMGTKSRQRKSPLPRGYPPPSTAMLFDDDPGIMSEVETSSTGFRRGGKQRSSLPVVRTPSKTLERPLGLVFLQYRKETKRALLPNEITSIDTVKALFVRSFPKQLTMEYLDMPDVKIYIHDSNKDMFYELEDHRSHLRDIRDRSVLRLIEKTDTLVGMPGGPVGIPVGGQGLPPHWEDPSYFSEPEFDSEFQHQHIHKSKTAKNSNSGSYYMGGSSTLPRGGSIMRAYSPASSILAGPNATPTQPKTLGTPGVGGVGGGGVSSGGVAPAKPLRGYQCGKTPLGSLGASARFSRDSSVSLYSIPDRIHGESGYMSSPERTGGVGSSIGRYPIGPYSAGSSYEEPYYSQYSGTVTPVIDEEASDTELLEESYSLYGVKPSGRPPSGPPRSPFPPGAPALPPGPTYDVTRIRVEHMERQLANLTGLVQKALTHAPHPSPSPRDYLQVPAGRDPYARSAGAGNEFDKNSSSSSVSMPDDSYLRTDVKPPKLGKDKSVSFEKSVSFSDEPPDMNSPKQHSPQHAADTKPTKPAIKSSTLPRMSSQERDRHKPTPPPKPVALTTGPYVYRDLSLTPEMYNQLRGLQKKAKDLRQEVRNLRRMSQAQAHTVRETIRDTFITIRSMLLTGGDAAWAAGDTEKIRLSREEDLYKQEMIRLENDLTELESTVEELRGNVINRKTRVNMSDVENMALILSKSSKTVADLKVRFPNLQEGMKGLLSSEMEKVVREEKFLKEEPERLESALRRCKKLTGTLVTLKRLASVQEQRLPNAVNIDNEETPPTPTSAQHSKTTAPVPAERTIMGSTGLIGGGSYPGDSSTAYQQRPENALDALLDELQTFSRPSSQLSQVSGINQTTTILSSSSTTTATSNHMPTMLELGRSASQILPSGRAPNISEIGRKGSIDSSSSLAIITTINSNNNTLRRLHSYPSSSDTDTSPPIARIQITNDTNIIQQQQQQKPPVPERNAELLQLATSRRVPPPPPPRTSSRSPLASPTSPQLPPRNPNINNCNTLRRSGRPKDICKPPMALPPGIDDQQQQQSQSPQTPNILSTSNSSSCESINSQEGMQNKKGRQEQLEQRHQELLKKQKALQEQYARLQQLQRNASGLATVPPTPPDLLKKTGSESNILAKMGLGMSTASSGSLTSLTINNGIKINNEQQQPIGVSEIIITPATPSAIQTTTSKVYETDIL